MTQAEEVKQALDGLVIFSLEHGDAMTPAYKVLPHKAEIINREEWAYTGKYPDGSTLTVTHVPGEMCPKLEAA